MVSGITLREFDELALRYAQVFHYSFTWKGLRSWQLRVALYCFAGMLISFVPYAWATGTGWLNQLLYLIPVLAQGLMEGIESNAGNYLGIAVFAVMMSVLVIVMLGFSFMAGGAIYTVVLDCYMKRCSVQSRERLVQELLKRACLV